MGMEDMVDTIMGKDLQRSFLNNISTKDLLMLDMAMVMGIVMDMDMVMDMGMDMDLDMGMEDMVDTIMGKDLQRSFLNNITTKDLLMLDMAMVMGIVMDMAMVVMDTVMDMATMVGSMVMDTMEVISTSI